MKKSKFETSDDIGTLTFPDETKIKCSTCELRNEDIKSGDKVIKKGATLGICAAFSIKPYEILFKNEDCPYYIKEEK